MEVNKLVFVGLVAAALTAAAGGAYVAVRQNQALPAGAGATSVATPAKPGRDTRRVACDGIRRRDRAGAIGAAGGSATTRADSDQRAGHVGSRVGITPGQRLDRAAATRPTGVASIVFGTTGIGRQLSAGDVERLDVGDTGPGSSVDAGVSRSRAGSAPSTASAGVCRCHGSG